MNLLTTIAAIRGRPYPKPPTGDVLDCVEVADGSRLCCTPLVSVIMITYNHAQYIRAAIEGVMAQRAPFDYELLIGEDCSTDGTRLIAKQVQKEFPDRIRLFYSDHNVGWNCNIERLRRRARGKYIAWCEGDDYWTDSKKLVKQVMLIERTDTVVSFAFNNMLLVDGTLSPQTCICPEIIRYDECKMYFHLSTYLIRAEVLSKAHNDYPNIPEWYDTVMMPILATYDKISVLPEVVSVYRVTNMGIATSLNGRQKLISGLGQSVALYLYGPKECSRNALLSILRECALYFYSKSSAGSLRTREGCLVMSLFLRCFPLVFLRCRAWKSAVYLLLSQIGIRRAA